MANYNPNNPNNPNNIPDNRPVESSGMGVVAGILLAVVIAVGAYFFIQNREAADGNIEPAAGIEAPMSDTTTTAPAPAADPNPAPTPAP